MQETSMELKRILLVENEPETARFIESELQNLGLNVKTVTNGNEAWGLLLEEKPAILICDENMQGIVLRDLGKRIRSEPTLANLPIIFIVEQILEDDKSHFLLYYNPYADITLERRKISEIAMWVQRILREVESGKDGFQFVQ